MSARNRHRVGGLWSAIFIGPAVLLLSTATAARPKQGSAKSSDQSADDLTTINPNGAISASGHLGSPADSTPSADHVRKPTEPPPFDPQDPDAIAARKEAAAAAKGHPKETSVARTVPSTPPQVADPWADPTRSTPPRTASAPAADRPTPTTVKPRPIPIPASGSASASAAGTVADPWADEPPAPPRTQPSAPAPAPIAQPASPREATVADPWAEPEPSPATTVPESQHTRAAAREPAPSPGTDPAAPETRARKPADTGFVGVDSTGHRSTDAAPTAGGTTPADEGLREPSF
jgi:hypothetical protein